MFLLRLCVPRLRLFKPTLSLHQFRDKEWFIQRGRRACMCAHDWTWMWEEGWQKFSIFFFEKVTVKLGFFYSCKCWTITGLPQTIYSCSFILIMCFSAYDKTAKFTELHFVNECEYVVHKGAQMSTYLEFKKVYRHHETLNRLRILSHFWHIRVNL